MVLEIIPIIIQLFINGIINGLIYAMMALGFALILEGIGLYNFAHGAFYVTGGYIVYFFIRTLNINPLISIIVATFFTAALGYMIERTIISPIRQRGGREWMLAGLIAMLSLSVFMENFYLITLGPEYRGLLPFIPGHIKLASIIIDSQKLVNGIVSLCAIVFLHIFLNYTKLGLAIRALTQHGELAELCGINIFNLYPIIFAIGVTLAGLAGILLTSVYYISPTVGHFPGLISFIVVIIAGLGSIIGLVVAGLIIGIVDIFTNYFLSAEWSYIIAFTIAIFILTFRPKGLFGIKRE
jgi:branched-chain amino acid transport system permease protein